MGLSAEQLKVSLDALSKIEPRFAVALSQVGYPEPRVRARGYETLLRTIVGQQVSFQAAAAVWAKLEAARGDMTDPHAVIDASFDDLRACGLSRQKQGYARSLAELVKSGALDLHNLPSDDEEAIARLTQVKGIGRWSAEIYLLFAEGRPDIWPAGDLAVQIDVGQIMGLPERPGERQVREIGEAWRPHRGAAAVFAWHHYKTPGI
ncbi:MAG: DNA-3-methyladenine glycosylase 2 family protein [Sphingomonadales bacterium]|jgi:DNA-3-methyladenine glycosylase II|nr:DNA-3-methyladenine glycosylase 2 family protein [Sphingomonadales bacterium]MBP7136840.1 DNA-3-methyladenine glycosylase 2 family protein [Sphingomonadaceae bacterium]MBK6492291.1 DNA-3-methyladenine glycosylase 2 family protein [Sphingomonadales bacterium]MBK6720838.1 DNA-3-methyladenine glycosylase 2 family protein [Sphingomonadales bacterium]MBK8860516.1 DNA-3-methyladenine glycosylase 2 family protein [Sphingomonadales bacterium]